MLERMRLFFQRYPQLADCFSAPAVRKSPTLGSVDETLMFASLVRRSGPNGPTSVPFETKGRTWSAPVR